MWAYDLSLEPVPQGNFSEIVDLPYEKLKTHKIVAGKSTIFENNFWNITLGPRVVVRWSPSSKKHTSEKNVTMV
jgi:hypothetical protein